MSGGFPFEVPISYALFTEVTASSSHQLVMHASTHYGKFGLGFRTRFDSRYLEFRAEDRRKNTHRRLPFLKKGISSESRLQSEFILMNFQSRVRTHWSRLDRLQRCSGEICRKTFFNGSNFLRRSKQTGTPFRKNLRNPVVVFFRDEIVQVGIYLEQRGIERSLSGIARMQTEVFIGQREGRSKRVVG